MGLRSAGQNLVQPGRRKRLATSRGTISALCLTIQVSRNPFVQPYSRRTGQRFWCGIGRGGGSDDIPATRDEV